MRHCANRSASDIEKHIIHWSSRDICVNVQGEVCAMCATPNEIDTPLVLARGRKRAVVSSLVSGSVALFHFDMMEV